MKSDHTVFLMRSFKSVTVWNLFLVPCGVFFTFLIKCDFEVKADTAFNPALLLPLAACVTGSSLSWCFCPGASGSEQASSNTSLASDQKHIRSKADKETSGPFPLPCCLLPRLSCVVLHVGLCWWSISVGAGKPQGQGVRDQSFVPVCIWDVTASTLRTDEPFSQGCSSQAGCSGSCKQCSQQWEFAPVGAAGLSVADTSGMSRSTGSS